MTALVIEMFSLSTAQPSSPGPNVTALMPASRKRMVSLNAFLRFTPGSQPIRRRYTARNDRQGSSSTDTGSVALTNKEPGTWRTSIPRLFEPANVSCATRSISQTMPASVMPGTIPTTASVMTQVSGENCISPGSPPRMRTTEQQGGVCPMNSEGVWENAIACRFGNSFAASMMALMLMSGRQMCDFTPLTATSTRQWPELAIERFIPQVLEVSILETSPHAVGSAVIS